MNNDYKKVQKWYDKNVERYTNRSAILLHTQLKYFISKVSKNGKVLDIGCGPGHDTEYFAKNGFQSTGIDFSTKMIQYAKNSRTAGTFKKIDMLKLAKHFSKNYFDGVWLSSSLTHLRNKDIVKVLKQIKIIVAPQHPIIIIVKKKTKRKNITNKIIFTEFYKKDVIEYLKKSNLQLKKIITITVLNSQWLFIHAQKIS